MYTITVCGGGNAAHVLLGLLGAKSDISVRLFDTLPDEVGQFQGSGGSKKVIDVVFKDGRDKIQGIVDQASASAEDVIPGSDMIILAVPAFAHQLYFEQIVKHAKPDCIVGVMVAKGGVDWQFKDIFQNQLDRTEFFAMENLPWACRIQEYGRSVEVLSTKLALEIAVLSDEPQRVIDKVTELISIENLDDPSFPMPNFTMAPNFISCSLRGNLGHACIMYGRFHNWDGKTPFEEIPLFYEGVDEFAAKALEQASEESMAIKKALTEQLGIDLNSVIPAKDWLIRVYGDEISDQSTLQSCIKTNKGYEGLKHAMVEVEGGFFPSKNSRYLTEDLPFGILVVRGIAEIMEVPTPMLDRVIEWNQTFMGKEYLVDGKLAGKDVSETRAPQSFGITSPSELVGEVATNAQ